MLTEDEVRTKAEKILKFELVDGKSGFGQITTFNQLGFKGVIDKPDGWFLPSNRNDTAIIVETKSEKTDIKNEKWIDELKKNCKIVLENYTNVIGILYNGKYALLYKNNEFKLETDHLSYYKEYLDKFENRQLNKQEIYSQTARINDLLHFDFGVKNLYERMIFTACALVAERYQANLMNLKQASFDTFMTQISDTLKNSFKSDQNQNNKLDILLSMYHRISTNNPNNQEAIGAFIDAVCSISDKINSSTWRGEDVMGIFFNEFNRYKSKSENGQVFTPDHITSFMYRLLEINSQDYVLDATCGSGAFLVKSMGNMLDEIDRSDEKAAKEIKGNHLFGIEFDKEIFALACANMLIHKDGKTNLEQMDTRSDEAKSWIKDKPITKVLMNPPYENKYGCLTIVNNVLESVSKGTLCGFILPDTKLDKASKKWKGDLLRNNRIEAIIKLPENLFFGIGVATSIFIIKAGYSQNDSKIFGCYIENDGLETVKNKGRHDVHNVWKEKEDYWVESFRTKSDKKYKTEQWIDPRYRLSYQKPLPSFTISDKDFMKTAFEYRFYKNNQNIKEWQNTLADTMMYHVELVEESDGLVIKDYDNND